MNLVEAIMHMEQGGKVRLPWWNEKKYVCIDKNDCIVDNEGQFTLIYGKLSNEWEVFEEKKKDERLEAAQVFKDLYKAVNEISKLSLEEDIVMHFVELNDFNYSLTELHWVLRAMNNLYKLDDKNE